MSKKAVSLAQLEEALRDMARWIREKLSGYVAEPAAEGPSGWVLTTNGDGGRSWEAPRTGDPDNRDIWRPTVSVNGDITWERSFSLEAPEPMNIRGPKGFNHNLLDNWYFPNPVNQREETSGNGATSAGYFIDRWARMGYAAGAVSVANSELEIDCTQAPGSCRLVQTLEFATPVGTYTASVLATGLSGKGYIDIYAEDGTFAATVDIEQTGITSLVVSGVKIKKFYIGTYAGSVIRVSAAKLELGDTQTLAHQDEDGNWQLNEIPNYAEELAKCRRYYQRYGGEAYTKFGFGVAVSASNARVLMPILPMRITKPSCNTFGVFALDPGNSIFEVAQINLDEPSYGGPYACLSVSISGDQLTPRNVVLLQAYDSASSYIELSADL